MSDEEIKLDLQQQRFEKAIAKELEDTANIIKKTGVFSQIDKLYGDIESTEETGGEEVGNELPGDVTSPPPPVSPPSGGDNLQDMGGGDLDMGGDTPPPPLQEGRRNKKDLPLILENKGILLPNIEDMTKKTHNTINELNKEIDNLVKE